MVQDLEKLKVIDLLLAMKILIVNHLKLKVLDFLSIIHYIFNQKYGIK